MEYLTSTGRPDEQATDETALVHALQRLLVLAESYPALEPEAYFSVERSVRNVPNTDF